MNRARTLLLLCLGVVLSFSSGAVAQPKLIITSFASDLSNDGNTVVGTILDPNVYSRLLTFTRGSGFQARGPIMRGYDGALKMSDITAGSFTLSAGLYNGFAASTYWPPSNPALFGNYSGNRACCNGTTCIVVDKSQCLAPAYTIDNTSTCSPGLCPSTPPAFGGCCNAQTGVCTYISQASCIAPNYFIAGNLACGSYPCTHGHILPFRYSTTTDSWTNCGSFPNNTGGPGQGATYCDGTIATPYGISADGRYIVGGGLYGPFGTQTCSTRGFVYDNTAGAAQMLPLIGTNAGCQNFSQGWAVGVNGAVLGRDTHATTNPSGGLISCNGTCLAVWEPNGTGQYLVGRTLRACCTGSTCTVVDPTTCPTGSIALAATACTAGLCPASAPATGACCNGQSMNCSTTTQALCGSTNFWIGDGVCTPHNPCLAATETVLDEYGAGSLLGAVMTRSGTTIAGTISSGKADYVLSDSSKNGDLCKYIKNAGTGAWDFVYIGRVAGSAVAGGYNMQPRAISDDGNTITGSYAGGSFIWRPTLNAGVPMDFGDYLRSINGGQPFPPSGGLALLGAMSADGNALLASWTPPGPESCPPNTGLAGLGRGAILYLDGSNIPCQPPAIAGGPYDVFEREYTRYGMVGNVFVAGSYPLTMQWQREDPPMSNNWVNLSDSCGTFTFDNTWTYEGTQGFQLRVNELADASVRDGRYRVTATNSCGTAISAVANISAVSGACCFFDTNSGMIACTVVIGTRCTGTIPFGLAGVYVGDGTTCSPTACDPMIGACCTYPGAVQCSLDISTHCTNAVSAGGLAGTFTSGGTACSPVACDAVSGACCYSADGFSSVTCSVELASRCTRSTALGGIAGVYAGNGIACAPSETCPMGTIGIGACCFNATATSDIACSVQASTHCTATYTNAGLQGKYLGDGVACGVSTCKPALFGTGGNIGACCFTDPANIFSGSICIITYQPNCANYPDGSNDANAAPFNTGLGGNFYTNTCCMPSSTPPISGCSITANCDASAGACISTPYDNSSGVMCTIQVRASRCTRRYNVGGLFGTYVAGSTCSPAVLAANAGACCYQPTDFTGSPNGCVVCTIQPQSRCTTTNNGGLSGVYAGNGTTCEPLQCPAQYGACCNGNVCSVVARSACTGTLIGTDSTTCVNVVCPPPELTLQPPPSGACCNTASLACTITTRAGCTSANAWLFRGTCSPENSCARPFSGACCIITTCIVSCDIDCANNGGTYRGHGSVCSPDPCAATGVCCRGATCGLTGGADCIVASGTAGASFVGAGSCGGSATTPCCYANYNKVNGISVQDIFDFLSDWFAGRPYAKVGGDGVSGTLNVQDIFNFLSAWFAGGCS